ncbi:hypothetical protein Poly30_13830 [Planctomycetes bacterium Poly30]|uniref:Uncharacterized protein n=1 Tax=Saltatorellus ferox TaxID=2528018 RepID=A0A518EP69_9BACT|nr:hypothetical protein Poly30_13830 [Planctomycetes bacterium Poly30]
MTWKPSNAELAAVWLATQDLVRRGKLQFNPSRQHGSKIPASARDLVNETNQRGLDLMREGSCVYPPTHVLDLLATERGVDRSSLFSDAEIEAELAEIARVDALIAEASANDRPLAEAALRSVMGAKDRWRPLLEAGIAFALVLPSLAFVLVLLERYRAHARILLGVLLLGFGLTALELFRGVLNPARFFRSAEVLRAAKGLSRPSKRGVVYHVALDVAFFFALFVATAAAYDAVDPTAFLTEGRAPGVIGWLLYGLDNLVRTVGLDVAEVFGLSISPITHADAFLPQSLVFSFRTLFSVFGIALIVEAAKRYGSR